MSETQQNSAELSPSAQMLLVRFKQKHGITVFLKQANERVIVWIPHTGHAADAVTELEAVRARCKQLDILCEL